MARDPRPPRDKDKEQRDRIEQDRLDREARQAARQREKQDRDRRREIRDREERIRPERVKGDRPRNPRPGQLLHDLDQRRYLRYNEDKAAIDQEPWEEVERHRKCDHWVKKGDPVELHVHECVGDKTPTVVFQCEVCQAKYRMLRDDAEYFRSNHRNECPTCATPYGENQPRDAMRKDF